ncbi:MAG TPA: NAD(P)H-dependent oxidoreductase [Leptolinea sp.]
MKTIVLNGSPKGDISVTMQYVGYLQKVFPQHEFKIINIALQVKHLENNPQEFDAVIKQVRQADAVLWAFPLYILTVHGNYKRFIELISERGVQDAFAGKYTAALSTSIHFFDHTAHNYIHAVCDDLDMKYVDFLSADMDDLHKEEGRRQLIRFGQQLIHAVENKIPTQKRYLPLQVRAFNYNSGNSPVRLPVGNKKVVILHDEDDPESNLGRMIARCRDQFEGDVKVVNINRLNIKGDCLGCMLCGSNNQCFYTGKDDFIEFYKSTVMTADIIIYAGKIVDRYLSSRWKTFFDRLFFNTHTPVLEGKQTVLLISGPIGQISNLQEIIQAFFEFQDANFVGFVSDETGTSAEIDAVLDQTMSAALDFSLTGYHRTPTFLGEGGMKIFRDDIYGRLRTVFMADHRAYKRMGVYKTFPQVNFGTQMLNFFIAPLVNLPPIRRKFDTMMKVEMVKPLQKIVEKTGA